MAGRNAISVVSNSGLTLGRLFSVLPCGLKIEGHPSFEQWSVAGLQLGRCQKSVLWWLGDWINYGEHEYGEKYAQALSETEFEYQTVQNAAWVCRQVTISLRRENLYFGHHALVASLPPSEQKRWLEKAEAEGWTVKQLRQAQIDEPRKALAAAFQKIKPSDRWIVHQADMSEWKTEQRFDWIITDPPYPREYLPLYETLALRSRDWLEDGGLLVAMCGESYLHEIFSLMAKHLRYYWTAAYMLPGQPTPMRQVNVNCSWKPLLMFCKGEYTGKIFGDVFRSEADDKDFHEWGQSVSGMYDIVSKLVLPGQSILDPFCGAGTTGIAAIKHDCLFVGVEIDTDCAKIARRRIHDCCKA